MEVGEAGVGERIASVAASLEPRIAELASDICDLIQRDIPKLGSDAALTSLLDASVDENVVTVVHMLRHGIVTAHVEAPTAALEYARRLAQRGIPATTLIRAYRVGQARFLRHCIDELLCQTPGDHVEGTSTQRMVEHVSDTLDRVIEQVIAAYDTVGARRTRRRAGGQLRWVGCHRAGADGPNRSFGVWLVNVGSAGKPGTVGGEPTQTASGRCRHDLTGRRAI